jgi:hypothetical protein
MEEKSLFQATLEEGGAYLVKAYADEEPGDMRKYMTLFFSLQTNADPTTRHALQEMLNRAINIRCRYYVLEKAGYDTSNLTVIY